MALTTGSASDDAQRISPPGVTRVERLGHEAVQAAAATPNSVGANSYGSAFIDGNSLPRLDADNTPEPASAAQINGEGTGFPGLANEGYANIPGYPPAGAPQPAKSAQVVNRQARVVSGGQPAGTPADTATQAFLHGNAPGFPYQLPSTPRET